MSTNKRNEYLTRDTIMRLLSDDDENTWNQIVGLLSAHKAEAATRSQMI